MCLDPPAPPAPRLPSTLDRSPAAPTVRRIFRHGRGWSMRIPTALLRALNLPLGGTVLLRPLQSGGFAVEPLGQGVELAREQLRASGTLAQLLRQNARLRARAAHVDEKTLAAGFTVGYGKACTALHYDLSSFLDDYRAGRVMVLPVSTDPEPPPPLALPPEVVGGEAVAPGGRPQGHP